MYSKASLLIAAVVALGVTASPPASPPDLSGTYVLDRSASDDPKHALEAATSSMRRFKRNAVNKRIEEEMKPADTVTIAEHGDSVVLATSGRLHLTVVPGGEAKSRTGAKGGTAELTSAWDGDALVVKTTSERFQRDTRYSLDNGGSRIRIAITMRAGELPQAISYTLVYRRVAGASGATPTSR
jgi:hypothetical protein